MEFADVELRMKIRNYLKMSKDFDKCFRALRNNGFLVYELEDSPARDGEREHLVRIEDGKEKWILDVLYINKTEDELAQEYKPEYKQNIEYIHY